MNDYVLTVNGDGDLAIRTVPGTEDSNVTDTTSVITRTDDGKLAVRVVGGGDSSNLGYFATLQALQEAYPTAEPGNWAIVGTTDTVWVWDEDTSAWVDTDQKGQVTSVNNQTGDVTVQETLVSGTNIKSINGNSILGAGDMQISGFLPFPAGWTTNGTTKALCDDIAADTTTVKGSAFLGEVTCSDLPASIVNSEINVYINDGTTAADKVIILELTSGNVAPYRWIYVYWNGGTNTSGWQTWQETLVSGTNIKTVNGNSLLGSGNITTTTMSVPTAPTLAVADWSSNTQTVTVTGVTASNTVIVSPAPASAVEYAACGILCTTQGTDSLTFTCTAVPANALTVNVVILN